MYKIRKSLCVTGLFLCVFSSFAFVALLNNNQNQKSDSQNETFTLNFDVNDEITRNASFKKQIASGNYFINFHQNISNDISEGNWRTLYKNDYIYVANTPSNEEDRQEGIRGLTSLSYVGTGNLKVSYGWNIEEYEIIGDSFTNNSYSFNDIYPTYFKIYNDSLTPIDIESFTITYSCEIISPTSKGVTLIYKGQGQGYKVKAANKNITEATIPSSYLNEDVNEIEMEGFKDCTSLTSIDIPSSIKLINRDAFCSCTSLSSLTLREGLEEIGSYAFSSCSSLTSISIPSTLNVLNDFAFGGCSNLTSINVDSKNQIFDSRENCNAIINKETNTMVLGIKTSSFPSSVTKIGARAFGDSNIESFSIPDSIIEIDSFAFVGSQKLTSLSIPETSSITSLPTSSFADCSALTTVEILNDLTSFGDQTFYGCISLTSINIPDSVTSIGKKCFYECSSLNSISIPDSVTNIGEGCFKGCSSLEDVSLSNNLTTISNSLFYDCISLTEINFTTSITSIGNYSFCNCQNLESLYIPANITSISNNAFILCSKLNQINVNESNEIYRSGNNSNAIIETSSRKLLLGCVNTVFDNSIISIGENAFYGCTSLTSLTIPSYIESIQKNSFYACAGLISIVVDSNNTIYDSRENCNAIIEKSTSKLIVGCLNSIIPDDVISIGEGAFYKQTNLVEIVIPKSVTNILTKVFYGCSSLNKITYSGTTDEYKTISRGLYWHYDCPVKEVICSNGTIDIDPA